MKQLIQFGYNRPYLSGIILTLLGCILICAGVTIAAVIATQQLFSELARFQPSDAKKKLVVAQAGASLCTAGTLGLLPECEVWNQGLTIAREVLSLEIELETQLAAQAEGELISIAQFPAPLLRLSESLEGFSDLLSKTSVITNVLTPEQRFLITQSVVAAPQVRTLAQLLTQLSQGTQTWIVLLQNSDELRATGGFPGSYIKLELQQGRVTQVVVEDIYDADGQFTGSVNAPHGVAEYTSQGKGLRLPDANWNPDFAQSAQTMLTFFSQSNRTAVSGLVAVNLNVGTTLLELTGPVVLPDYNTTLSADNLHSVLREERDHFFAGSIQKKHLISQALTAVRIATSRLSSDKQHQLFESAQNFIVHKDIQAFAIDPQTQEALRQLQVTGQLPSTPFIAVIESNVGINKVNRFISRTISLTATAAAELRIESTFTNHAQSSDATTLTELLGEKAITNSIVPVTGYANYWRVLVPVEYNLASVRYAGATVEPVHTEVIEHGAVSYRQIGMLLPLLPGETRTVNLVLKPQAENFSLHGRSVTLIKQSGLQPTVYTIATPERNQTIILERDIELPL